MKLNKTNSNSSFKKQKNKTVFMLKITMLNHRNIWKGE